MALCRSDQKMWNLLAFRWIFTIIAVLQPGGETDGHGPAQLLPPSSGFEHPSFCSELLMICSEINLKKKNLTRIPSHLVTASRVWSTASPSHHHSSRSSQAQLLHTQSARQLKTRSKKKLLSKIRILFGTSVTFISSVSTSITRVKLAISIITWRSFCISSMWALVTSSRYSLESYSSGSCSVHCTVQVCWDQYTCTGDLKLQNNYHAELSACTVQRRRHVCTKFTFSEMGASRSRVWPTFWPFCLFLPVLF